MTAVAVLVPTLDEERYVGACLRSLVGQDLPGGFEVLVLDGGSTDGTRAEVGRVAAESPVPVRWVENPGRLQAAAINLGAHATDAPVLVRCDAHATYPPGFLATVTGALREHGATSVVVPMVTTPEPAGGGLQRAIAATQASRLGNGGSAHRTGGESGWVDHGHHAAFDRAFFLELGGYVPTLAVNEDAELDHRAALAGGRVWMCRQAPITYFPRRRLGSLARQYLRFGAGRAQTSRRHGVPLGARQLAPLAILGGCVSGTLVAPRVRPAALVPLGYAGLCASWGAVAAARERDPWLLAMGPAAMTMHLAWAVGFLQRTARLSGGR